MFRTRWEALQVPDMRAHLHPKAQSGPAPADPSEATRDGRRRFGVRGRGHSGWRRLQRALGQRKRVHAHQHQSTLGDRKWDHGGCQRTRRRRGLRTRWQGERRGDGIFTSNTQRTSNRGTSIRLTRHAWRRAGVPQRFAGDPQQAHYWAHFGRGVNDSDLCGVTKQCH